MDQPARLDRADIERKWCAGLERIDVQACEGRCHRLEATGRQRLLLRTSGGISFVLLPASGGITLSLLPASGGITLSLLPASGGISLSLLPASGEKVARSAG